MNNEGATLLEVKYDNMGRMEYHPDFHPNQNKMWTLSELEYLCKFYKMDGSLSMSLALGRTQTIVSNTYARLKKDGLCDFYRNLNVFYVDVD